MTPEQKEEARRIALRRQEERYEFWRLHDLRRAHLDAEREDAESEVAVEET